MNVRSILILVTKLYSKFYFGFILIFKIKGIERYVLETVRVLKSNFQFGHVYDVFEEALCTPAVFAFVLCFVLEGCCAAARLLICACSRLGTDSQLSLSSVLWRSYAAFCVERQHENSMHNVFGRAIRALGKVHLTGVSFHSH